MMAAGAAKARDASTENGTAAPVAARSGAVGGGRRSLLILKRVGRIVAGVATVLLLVLGALAVMFTAPQPAMAVGVLILAVAIGFAVLINRRFGAVLLIFTTLATALVGISQATASTPPIVDSTGHIVAGSVAAMEQVSMGGTNQWIVMRGKSASNPVLLFLAGGPGGTETGWVRKFNAALEDHFVVVNWEQPGAGKSNASLWDSRTLTPQQYVQDGLQLTNYLRQRFHQDKIYLVGHSWGTFLGVWMVQQHPELFKAYVGVGQMVDPTTSDRLGYEDVISREQRDGNTAIVQKLRANGPPPYYGSLMLLKYMDYFGPQDSYMAMDERASGGKPYLGNPFDDILSPEYGLADRITSIGVMNPITFTKVYQQLDKVDFRVQAPKLDVPVYFVQGRHDLNNWAPLAAEYFRVLQAPHKEMLWNETSAHNVLYEDPNWFNTLMVATVLKQTQSGR